LKAKTSYRRCRIELIVERLEAERKELDIGIEAELDAERREVESSMELAGKLDVAVEVASIGVVAKVGRICLYSEVAEKVGQADLYASNLLAFLEDSEVEAVAEHIEIARKLDIEGKLEVEDSS
jgi:hypothetical protein